MNYMRYYGRVTKLSVGINSTVIPDYISIGRGLGCGDV
jgi:hypothetical protein